MPSALWLGSEDIPLIIVIPDSIKHLMVFMKVVKLVESVFSVRAFLLDSDEDNCDSTTGGFSIGSVHYVYIVIFRALSSDNSHPLH